MLDRRAFTVSLNNVHGLATCQRAVWMLIAITRGVGIYAPACAGRYTLSLLRGDLKQTQTVAFLGRDSRPRQLGPARVRDRFACTPRASFALLVGQTACCASRDLVVFLLDRPVPADHVVHILPPKHPSFSYRRHRCNYSRLAFNDHQNEVFGYV